MTRKALALAVMAVLIALVGGAGRALASGGTYHINAGGNLNWQPSSGAFDRTAPDAIDATGTLVGLGNASGRADYKAAAGPGIARASYAGSVTGAGDGASIFNPSLVASATTELTISGPAGGFTTSVNIHVDGVIKTPVCGSGGFCGAVGVAIQAGPGGFGSEFDSFGETRVNDLGLAFDVVPGGFRVHGDVHTLPFAAPTNVAFPIVLSITLESSLFGSPVPTPFGVDFDDPAKGYQLTLAPTGPVLNDVPAGFTVSGPGVTNNRWTGPSAPPSGDVVVADCATLAQLTSVHGDLVIRNVPGCTAVSLPNLTTVDGDLVIEGNTGLATIDLGAGLTIGGDLSIVGNTGTTFIGAGAGSVGGSVDISDNTGTMVIGAGAGQVGGSVSIVDNGTAVVNASDLGTVAGSITIETAGDAFDGTTGGGHTDVTLLEGTASMHAVIPANAFDRPVSFAISRTGDTPPESGTAADGTPAQIDPIIGYRFAFDVPTLNADAHLSFTVDLAQLDAAGRATLLNAIAAGTGTVAVKGDDPGAAYHAFAQCSGTQTPTAGGCVAVTLLRADGTPASSTETPAFVQFDGVVGHFSSYAVVDVLPLDTTPPTVIVSANLAVDATGPAGARVTYAASAQDDHDQTPSLVCTPASGTTFAAGDTTVTCTGTDAARNSATARFVVHVRGASEQIVRLLDQTVAFLDRPALKPALKAALGSAVDAMLAKRPHAVCHALALYVAIVRCVPARSFTPAEQSELLAGARRIEAVIGC